MNILSWPSSLRVVSSSLLRLASSSSGLIGKVTYIQYILPLAIIRPSASKAVIGCAFELLVGLERVEYSDTVERKEAHGQTDDDVEADRSDSLVAVVLVH